MTSAANGDLPDYVRQTRGNAVEPVHALAAASGDLGDTGALKAGRKYGTPEERKNTAAHRRKKKADLMKRLYKEHQAKTKNT